MNDTAAALLNAARRPTLYQGTWKSAQARCKKLLVAAGFPWSVTTGVYHPFASTKKVSKGIRVSRIGCSDTVSVSAHGYHFSSDSERSDSRWMEALAIAHLRDQGLPVDDRGWIDCAVKSY